jgi:hypothetical protein
MGSRPRRGTVMMPPADEVDEALLRGRALLV